MDPIFKHNTNITFKNWSKAPASHRTSACKLSNGRFHEEQGNSDYTHHNSKRNEKCSTSVPMKKNPFVRYTCINYSFKTQFALWLRLDSVSGVLLGQPHFCFIHMFSSLSPLNSQMQKWQTARAAIPALLFAVILHTHNKSLHLQILL